MEKGKSEEGLTADEVLERVYERLLEENEYETTELPPRTQALIADDSVFQIKRKGYMKYKTANLFEGFGEKDWVLGNGTAVGAYPTRPYISDIIVIDLWENTELEGLIETKSNKKLTDVDREKLRKYKNDIPFRIKRKIKESLFFDNSLIAAMEKGVLGAKKSNKYADKLIEKLSQTADKYTDEGIELRNDIVTADLRRMPKEKQTYKPEFVDFLAESIEEVLSEYETR